jgi:hypothetical protein
MLGLLKDPRWFWLRVGAGVVLALAGAWVARRAFNEWGHDLAQLYMSAWLLREGRNVYDMAVQHDGYVRHIGLVTTWGHFYPPASAVALLPATVIPYWLARELWFYGGIAVMFYGLWRFMAAYIPAWDRSLRVLVLGLVMCTACVRWGFKVAQPASMIFGLFGLFLAELKTRRVWSLLLTAGFVGCVKVTFGIPFLLIVAAQRRFKTAAALLMIWGSMNLVGIVGMGGFKILADYRANMADFERPDQLNYPDPRGFNSLARTDWPYVLNAVDPSFKRNNAIGYGLTLATFAWLAWELARAKKATMNGDLATLALTGPAAAISMLSVYHHHYDMCFLLLPLIGYLGRRELYVQKAAWVYVIAVGLYAGLYPYAKFAELVDGWIGPSSVLFTKPLACVVCIVALISSGKVLRDTLRLVDPGRVGAPDTAEARPSAGSAS